MVVVVVGGAQDVRLAEVCWPLLLHRDVPEQKHGTRLFQSVSQLVSRPSAAHLGCACLQAHTT